MDSFHREILERTLQFMQDNDPDLPPVFLCTELGNAADDAVTESPDQVNEYDKAFKELRKAMRALIYPSSTLGGWCLGQKQCLLDPEDMRKTRIAWLHYMLQNW